MATIPLYNNGEMPRVPDVAPPSRIPTARLELDYGSLAAKTADAHKVPGLPRDFFRGDQIAAAAAADAVQKMGAAMSDLAIREMEAKDYADAEEMQSELRVHQLQFDRWRAANPDPEKWSQEFDRRYQAVQKDFEGRNYSGRTRGLMERSLKRFGEQGLINVEIDATKVQFARAHDSVRARRSMGVETGDIALVDQANRDAVGLGLEHPDVAADEHLKATKAIYQKQQSNLILGDPKTALDILEGRAEPPDFMADISAEERFRGIQSARIAIGQNQKAILDKVEADTESNTLTSVEQFEQEIARYNLGNSMDETTRKQAHKIIHGRVFDPGLFNQHRAMAFYFDKNGLGEDADLYEANLKRMFKDHPKLYQEQLEQVLQEAKTRTSGVPEGFKLVQASINELHKNEGLMDANGSPIRYKAEKFMMDALTDVEKTKVFGITEAQTKELRSIDGPARIDRFRELVRARTSGIGGSGVGRKNEIADIEAYNKLGSFTQKLFNNIMKDGPVVDQDNYLKSALREAELMRELHQFHRDNPSASEDDYVLWLQQRTSRERRAQGIRGLQSTFVPQDSNQLPYGSGSASPDLVGSLRSQLHPQ